MGQAPELLGLVPGEVRRVAAAAAVLTLLAFLPAAVGTMWGCFPFGEDALAYFVPTHGFARETLGSGTLPLWNPHLYCGMPFVADIQSGLFYLPNAIHYVSPAPWALLLDAGWHTWLLGCGAYLLARTMGLAPCAAAVSAVVMALGGPCSARIYAGQMIWLQSHAYVPWILWAALRFINQGRKEHALALAIFGALQALVGHPPTLLCTLLLCLVTLAYKLTAGKSRVGHHAGRAAGACGAGMLALSISAVTLLPFLELNRQAVHSELSYQEATVLSGTFKTMVRLMVPDFFGGNSGVQWSTRWSPHEEAAYPGMLPLLLATLAPVLVLPQMPVGSAQRRRLMWLWAALPLSLLLALGSHTPLYALLYNIAPPVRFLRVPLRWLDLWTLAAALLAGITFQSIFVDSSPAWKPTLALVCRALGLFMAALAVLCVLLPHQYWSPATDEVLRSAPGLDRSQVIENFRRVAVIAVLSCALLCAFADRLLLRFANSEGQKRGRLRIALVAFVAVDLLLLFWRSAKLVSPAELTDINWPTELADHYRAGERWDTSMFWQGINHASIERVDIFNGYNPLGTRRYFQYVSRSEGRSIWETVYQPARRSPLLAVAGVSHTLAGPRDPLDADTPFPDTRRMRLVKQAAGWTLWRHNQPAWPRQYLTTDIKTYPVVEQPGVLAALAANLHGQSFPVVVSEGVKSIAETQNLYP